MVIIEVSRKIINSDSKRINSDWIVRFINSNLFKKVNTHRKQSIDIKYKANI